MAMFIGHFALGFAARRIAPKQNLAVLMVAPLFCDVLFPVLLLLGWEQARIEEGATAFTPLALDRLPWSHSLVMSVVWSVAYAGVVWAFTRDRRGALVCAVLVFSHWVLDWVTHRPDMMIAPWSELRVGLGLWNSVPGTLVVELLLFTACVFVYFRATRPLDGVGRNVAVLIVAVLLIAYAVFAFGPPPPHIHALALSSLAGFVLVPVFWWFDRHRVSRSP